MPNYDYRRLQPADQLVYDTRGNLVGIRAGTSGDQAIFGLNEAEYPAVQALVSGAGISAPSATFANLPDPLLNAGNVIRVTDVGNGGSLWMPAGDRWTPLNGRAIALRTPVPFILPGSGFFANNGAYTMGTSQGSGTCTFSATSGAGVTATLSVAGFAGTSADVGRVITVDGGKQFTITAFGTTTTATGTLGATLSSVGPYANNLWYLATPLDKVYAACYMYFPALAIHSTSVAGWYFTVMSSTTVGTVQNVPYTSGQPTVPLSYGGFTVTGPGAFVQTSNADIQALAVTIPGGALGKVGGIETRLSVVAAASTNTKTARAFYGTAQMQTTTVISGQTFANAKGGITNIGVATAQKQTFQDQASGFTNGATYTPLVFTQDSTLDKVLYASLKIASGAGNVDWISLQEVEFAIV